MAAEIVVYRGNTFRRYPKSKNWSDGNYFRPSIHLAMAGVESLHREIWKDHFGPIPEGHSIHHRDGDTGNNDPSNLVCLSSSEHQAIHAVASRERGRSPKALAHMDAIRPKTVAWHRSEEGRAWHRQHGREAYQRRQPLESTCDHCGKSFLSITRRENDRFCTNACKSAWRRASGLDDVERICAACGNTFVVNHYAKTRTCSRTCAMRQRRAREAAGLQPDR